MKTVIVAGKTDAIINLNKIGVPIRGRSQTVLKIITDEHQNEINGLVNAGLIEVIGNQSSQTSVISSSSSNSSNTDTTKKNKGGRPKGSKNKSKDPLSQNKLAEEERRRVSAAEAETQKLNSRVIIGTIDGAKEGHMTRSAIDDIPDSEKTKASIEAMEKLEKEEEEDISLPDTPVDESNLDPSEQMGRRAVISTQSGVENVNMVNSILPEADSIRKADPFIDQKNKESKDVDLDDKDKKEISKEDDDFSDAFIKI